MGSTSRALLRRRPVLLGGLGLALVGPSGCDARAPKKLFPIPRGAMTLAVDGERLCWVTGPERGKLWVAKRDAGPAIAKHHSLEWARDLKLFGDYAYVAVARGVLRAPVHGGPSTDIASHSSGAQRLAVDPSGVFWLERRTGVLWSLAHHGGEPRRLATGPSWANAIALDAHHVYWTAGQSGVLQRVPKVGGEVAVIHRADHPLTALVCDGERLYWCTPTAVMALPLAGGTPEAIAVDQAAPTALVTSQSVVCWVNQAGDQTGSAEILVRSKGARATPRSLIGDTLPQALALVGNTLYWADYGSRWIMRASVGT